MNSDMITLFEDRRKKLDLTKEQTQDLIALREVLGKQNITVDADGTVSISRYVGFISRGNTKIQILPKVFEKNQLDENFEIKTAIDFMIKLLRESKYNKILLLTEQQSQIDQTDLLELFIGVFANKIISVYSKQIYREYIDIQENSAFVKGRICFAENLRTNSFRKDLHVIRYQSFEQDNLINNVIKTVAERLVIISNSLENKALLKRALLFLDDARHISITTELLNSVRFNRLNEPFRNVYEMAKMFFNSETPNAVAGELSSFSFLVPLNKLFEYYLFKAVDSISEDSHAEYQNRKRFASDKDGKVFSWQYPDILFFKDDSLSIIIDAKYKNPLDRSEFKHVSQSDMYQLFAYARIYGVKRVAIVYPFFEEGKPTYQRIYLNDHDCDIEMLLICIDIKRLSMKEISCELKNLFLS